MEAEVVEESGDDIESIAAAEVPGFAVDGFVVDDEGSAKRAKWSGIKVEGSFVVLPGGQGGDQGGLMEKI